MENEGEQDPLMMDQQSEKMISVDIDKSDGENIEWTDDRIVWDLSELEHINKMRSKRGEPKIEIIRKHTEINLGIRAHTNMTFCKCLQSIFMPHQCEFIFIWLYLAFAIYFWVQVGFILAQDDSYGFKNEENYRWMLLATTILALSVTFTLVYLVFYCLSSKTERVLKKIDYNL